MPVLPNTQNSRKRVVDVIRLVVPVEQRVMSVVKLTAIVPVYRGERTLAEALRSILAQSVDGLEVIVLDDGSPDASWRIANEIKDERLVIVQHPNRGLAATLNRGIGLARGRYIARQDQDDVVLAGRLTKQMAFLDAHPDVAMVGTWAQIYSGDTPTERYHKHPCSCEALRLELVFDNPFVHSSMMIRTEALREIGGYCEDKSRQPPEDYELWSRIASRYRVANLPEVLTIYREMPESMSRTGDNPFLRNVVQIASENLSAVLAPEYSSKDCVALAELYHGLGETQARLSRSRVRLMLDEAAHRIGGPEKEWSDEFQSSFDRMRRHLDSRFLRRRIPAPLLTPARWIRDRLANRRA